MRQSKVRIGLACRSPAFQRLLPVERLHFGDAFLKRGPGLRRFGGDFHPGGVGQGHGGQQEDDSKQSGFCHGGPWCCFSWKQTAFPLSACQKPTAKPVSKKSENRF